MSQFDHKGLTVFVKMMYMDHGDVSNKYKVITLIGTRYVVLL